MDPLKTKKKRQIAQKGRIASDMNTEVEMLQERVKDSVRNIQFYWKRPNLVTFIINHQGLNQF
jgi:outer membrane lipoprotein-sorting protein